MPVVGKSFSGIGKDAFSPIVTGRRDELLKALLSFTAVGWHEARELPFDSFELLWAAERGLLTVRADVQWWSHGETTRSVKALFEVTGPFLYRRFVTALLQHPSTPIEWQLDSGRSDWIAPQVVQFKVNSKRGGLANALKSEPEESKLQSLTGYLRLLEQRFDYNGRGGVFDGRSKKQSADDAFKQVDVMGFPPVKILRWSPGDGFENPQFVRSGGGDTTKVTALKLAAHAGIESPEHIKNALLHAGFEPISRKTSRGHPYEWRYCEIVSFLRTSSLPALRKVEWPPTVLELIERMSSAKILANHAKPKKR